MLCGSHMKCQVCKQSKMFIKIKTNFERTATAVENAGFYFVAQK